MISTAMDRETLDAFVDGALSPEDSARLVLHLADCPGDAAYVDAVMETNALLAAAFAEPLHQPVPERINALIYPADPSARGSGWRFRPGLARKAGGGALAASAALAAGVLLAPIRDAPTGPSAASDPAREALAQALESGASGAVAGGPGAPEVTLIATFLDASGRPCREYEILDPAENALLEGLACREPAGWTTEIEVASRLTAPAPSADGFVPAQGAEAGALDAALDRLGAGMTLPPSEERALIERSWVP
jgi:hypothetical protein